MRNLTPWSFFGRAEGKSLRRFLVAALSVAALQATSWAQPPNEGGFGFPGDFPGFFGGPEGPGGPGGNRGPGGPGGEERKIVAKFDKDGNGWLNQSEREEALKSKELEQGARRGPGGGRAGAPVDPEAPVDQVTRWTRWQNGTTERREEDSKARGGGGCWEGPLRSLRIANDLFRI